MNTSIHSTSGARFNCLIAVAFAISLASPARGQDRARSDTDRALPKSTSIELQGLHAYADRESVPAGGTIHFHVSSQVPYQFRVTKLGLEVDDRASDIEIFRAEKPSQALVQKIHPGSFVRIEKGLPVDEELRAFSMECWVRPWHLQGWQGILTQHNYPENCGFGFFLNGDGHAVFSIGSGGAYERGTMVTGPKLNVRQWHHLAGTWDAETRTAVLWVDGERSGEWIPPESHAPRKPGPAQLRIGAYADKGTVGHFFDGDIATPVIYKRILTPTEIDDAYQSFGHSANITDKSSIAAHWPLDEERGNKISDASGNDRHGEIVNLGTWMIGGPGFDATAIGRYDSDYDPDMDADRGHALRLASDDLYDCGWQVSETFTVPSDAKSGLYAAWFDFRMTPGGEIHRYPVTFVVNKARQAEKAPIAVMCSTTTWRAYSGAAFARNVPYENRFWSTGGQSNDPAHPPTYNFYRDHAAGQPTYQVGLRLPWPVAGPDVRYSPPEVGYSHLMRGERFTHVWLEKQGYDFDVITNLDLHRDPELLNGYRTLIINGHDEYWSVPMYEGLDRYLENGGSVAVLSGNTMFWRISVDDDLGVIECRKYGPTIGGRKFAAVGEIYHSFDGKRGSLMRNAGHPAWRVIGLECSGWWGGSNNGPYTAKHADHFLFTTPEAIDFSDRRTFGGARRGFRQAGGHEGDIRLSSFAPATRPLPQGGVLPEEPEGIETLASLERENARALDYFARFEKQERATLVDMIYWQRPQGGKVFHAGAIGFGWTLDADPKQSRLMRNVLFHLAGVKAKTPYDPPWLEGTAK